MDAGALREDLLDGDGFLLSEDSGWSRRVARELAERNDLGPLTDEHWKIIEFVRAYYQKHREGPPVVKIAKATDMSSRHICELFPCGIAKGAYRLAGLPRPSGCL
ncbi:MAG: TusE/DsrC/DsvC family sulfur relay protein [Candidatus Latescibacterota bacterium]|nr:MAG: TusE/DsrC/DsvC family sulfur relay protein [Candidatus Latescibacterota bacterium]